VRGKERGGGKGKGRGGKKGEQMEGKKLNTPLFTTDWCHSVFLFE